MEDIQKTIINTTHLNSLIPTITLDTVLMILDLYQQDADKKLYLMEVFANIPEADKIKEAARSLKGSSANLGITSIINCARELEINTPTSSEELKKAVETLKNQFTLVKKELHNWGKEKKLKG